MRGESASVLYLRGQASLRAQRPRSARPARHRADGGYAGWGTRLSPEVDPIDPSLARELGFDALAGLPWLPWRRVGGTVIVASSVVPDLALRAEVAALLPGQSIDFAELPRAERDIAFERIFRVELLDNASARLARERPELSAAVPLARWQWWLPIVLLSAFGAGMFLRPITTFEVAFLSANAVFIVNIVFKTFASLRAPFRVYQRESLAADLSLERLQRGLGPLWPPPVPDEELPIYSILVPAYKEANIIGKLVANLGKLDYPSEKLDVLLLLEEDDEETIAAAVAAQLPEYMRIVRIPRGSPQTKPRACNYALPLCRGEYVVIFDAEDRPRPDQLRESVRIFRGDQFERERLGSTQKPLYVVQAALSYFNSDYNLLTRLFAVEYAFWFDGMMPGLDSLGLPVPLGGTSNHFAIGPLRELGAWDPHNVTEDADLGIRVSTHGGRVGVIDSVTWEEACADTGAWIRQRTRWIKGYMVTAAVNTRHPIRWTRHNGFRAAFSLFALILSTPLAFLSYPVILAFTAITYVGVVVPGWGIPPQLYAVGAINMIVGNLLMIVAGAIAGCRKYGWRLAAYAALNPIYWFLHATAAWRAAWQMYAAPHSWEKTPHGLTGEYVTAGAPS